MIQEDKQVLESIILVIALVILGLLHENALLPLVFVMVLQWIP